MSYTDPLMARYMFKSQEIQDAILEQQARMRELVEMQKPDGVVAEATREWVRLHAEHKELMNEMCAEVEGIVDAALDED